MESVKMYKRCAKNERNRELEREREKKDAPYNMESEVMRRKEGRKLEIEGIMWKKKTRKIECMETHIVKRHWKKR